ncbi:MAG: transporter substrate-binding domain-containing protein [Dysgonomonas sp.]
MTPRKKLIYSITFIIIILAACFLINKYVLGRQEASLKIKDYEEIKHEGTLHIVTDYNSLGYFVSGDTIAGFNHDMLQATQEYTDIKFKIDVENDLSTCIEKLENGTYDLIARNIPINLSLNDKIAFTQSIVKNKLVLVQKKPSKENKHEIIRNHLKLAKQTIYVPKSSPAILRLQNLSHEIGDTIFIREDSLYESSQLIMKVATGEIQYTVSDAYIASKLAKVMPEIDINTDIGFTHLEAWAVRKSSPILLDSLNAWIERFQSTKRYQVMYNKYYK